MFSEISYCWIYQRVFRDLHSFINQMVSYRSDFFISVCIAIMTLRYVIYFLTEYQI